MSQQIQREIADLLLKDTRDERLARVVITGSTVSADLRVARVYFTIMGDSQREDAIEQACDAFERTKQFLRRELGRKLRSKYTPELRFIYDETLDNARRIEAILTDLQPNAETTGGEEAMSLSAEGGIRPLPLPGGGQHLFDSLQQAAALINGSQSFVVAAHRAPDGDAIGSTLALGHVLREMGKDVVTYNADGVPCNFSFLPGSDTVVCDLELLPSSFDVLIIVDCSSLTRVHPDLTVDPEKTKYLCIDHHSTLDGEDVDLLVYDVAASSVGEIIYRLINELQLPLTRPVSECLFASIHTDTGSFRYSNTSPASLVAAGELVRAGVDVWGVTSQIYENFPAGRVHLLSEVLDTLRITSCGRLAFITIELEMYERTKTDSTVVDGFINFARGIRGVQVAVQMRQIEAGKYRTSFRSRGNVDVAWIAGQFGGGGHHNAAACTIEDTPENIVGKISAFLDETGKTQ